MNTYHKFIMQKITKRIISLILLFVVISSILLLQTRKNKPSVFTNKENIELKQGKYPKAPELIGTQSWINSEPLRIEELKGNVILVDFWTYTCINCIRTLPYLKEWDRKYRENGLIIIGVHTPEFEFEKNYENVLNAIKKYEINYPVVQDNDYATWRAYKNRFWPHKYLIDIDGFMRYDHIGEGGYEEIEKMIQLLLKEKMERERKNREINIEVNKPKEAIDVDFLNVKTPEIYLGYEFSRGNFGNNGGLMPEEVVDYKIPKSITTNNVYFSGKWKSNPDNIELVSDTGSILLKYHSKTVNVVAGSENDSLINIFLDDNYLDNNNKGSDTNIHEGKNLKGSRSFSIIKESHLYNLVSAQEYGLHTIKIDVNGRNFKLYTFTFG